MNQAELAQLIERLDIDDSVTARVLEEIQQLGGWSQTYEFLKESATPRVQQLAIFLDTALQIANAAVVLADRMHLEPVALVTWTEYLAGLAQQGQLDLGRAELAVFCDALAEHYGSTEALFKDGSGTLASVWSGLATALRLPLLPY